MAKVLGDEGIELISSTAFLEPLLAQEGVLTERAPDEQERKNIDYGLGVARAVAGFDIGQTVVVAAQACVAVEAMEGTDAAIERAGELLGSLEEAASHTGAPPDRREDRQAQAGYALRCPRHWYSHDRNHDPRRRQLPLSVEAGRTLLFDRDALLKRAGEAGIAIVAVPRRY